MFKIVERAFDLVEPDYTAPTSQVVPAPSPTPSPTPTPVPPRQFPNDPDPGEGG